MFSPNECVLLRRDAAPAGPSDDGGERDDWLREPDDDVMTQAYFDAKCAGDDGDWADLAYDKLTSTTELLRRSCSCSFAHALAHAPAPASR